MTQGSWAINTVVHFHHLTRRVSITGWTFLHLTLTKTRLHLSVAFKRWRPAGTCRRRMHPSFKSEQHEKWMRVILSHSSVHFSWSADTQEQFVMKDAFVHILCTLGLSILWAQQPNMLLALHCLILRCRLGSPSALVVWWTKIKPCPEQRQPILSSVKTLQLWLCFVYPLQQHKQPHQQCLLIQSNSFPQMMQRHKLTAAAQSNGGLLWRNMRFK